MNYIVTDKYDEIIIIGSENLVFYDTGTDGVVDVYDGVIKRAGKLKLSNVNIYETSEELDSETKHYNGTS